MKAIQIIPAAMIILQATFTMAATGHGTHRAADRNPLSFVADLSPRTPSVATFDDAATVFPEFSSLAPITPAVADFEEFVPVALPSPASLAPVLPAEADFSDAPEPDFSNLAPVTPRVADFE